MAGLLAAMPVMPAARLPSQAVRVLAATLEPLPAAQVGP
jgi:hypothetical protein